MKTNVGRIDKLVRVVAGLVIIGAAAWFKSWWGLVGLVPLATAWFGYCPLYTVVGFSTCPEVEPEKKEQVPAK